MKYIVNRVEVVDAGKMAVMGLVFTATLMFNGWSSRQLTPLVRLQDMTQRDVTDDRDTEEGNEKTVYKVAFRDGQGQTTDVSIDVATGKVVEVVMG
jgi:hypothetical protein